MGARRMNWKDRKALITGGAGFIGSHIADLLAARGASVIVLDNLVRGRIENLSEAQRRGNVRFVSGDIADRALLAGLMEGVDTLFHQAALRITHCAAEPRLALEVMFDGTFNVLEAAQRVGVRKVIAASSASVYGVAQDFPTGEEHHPYDNRTLYGAGKLALEGMLRSFNDMYGLQYLALRPFNVYGPRMDIHGAYTEVLVRWMEAIAAGRPPVIFGDGKQTMDFVYVEDVARANLLAAESEASDQVFNVCRNEEVSLEQLAATLVRVMGANLPLQYKDAPRRAGLVTRRLGDLQRAREVLGFEPQVSLEEGLRRLVAWWSEAKLAAVR
jgi:UDP-glucose 4-epimerase